MSCLKAPAYRFYGLGSKTGSTKGAGVFTAEICRLRPRWCGCGLFSVAVLRAGDAATQKMRTQVLISLWGSPDPSSTKDIFFRVADEIISALCAVQQSPPHPTPGPIPARSWLVVRIVHLFPVFDILYATKRQQKSDSRET